MTEQMLLESGFPPQEDLVNEAAVSQSANTITRGQAPGVRLDVPGGREAPN